VQSFGKLDKIVNNHTSWETTNQYQSLTNNS